MASVVRQLPSNVCVPLLPLVRQFPELVQPPSLRSNGDKAPSVVEKLPVVVLTLITGALTVSVALRPPVE